MTTTLEAPRAAVPPRGHFAKRAAILETAARVFAREGFAGASIDAIAAEASVSRQTIYNNIGDKAALFAAVVEDTTDKANAALFATLATFPDAPDDLAGELTAFARRLAGNCLCNEQTAALRQLVENEGHRHPEMFRAWQERGPGRVSSAIAARLLGLAHRGYLDIDDPELAARQFMTLVYMDLKRDSLAGRPTEAAIRKATDAAVRTFLRAYGKRAGSA